jgi:Zn-dependent protease
LLGLTFTDLVARAVALLFGFSVHEAAHAWVAYRLGDDTAKRHGRLTLNPLVHLDPLGSIMALVAMFGWAKPVPVSPWLLRPNPRVGNAIVAAAGPLSNLLMAAIAAVPWRMGLFVDAPPLARSIASTFILLNVVLFVFNLIPLAPLDGMSVLMGFVGDSAAHALEPLTRFGPLILLGLVFLPNLVPGMNPLSSFLTPAITGVLHVLLGI